MVFVLFTSFYYFVQQSVVYDRKNATHEYHSNVVGNFLFLDELFALSRNSLSLSFPLISSLYHYECLVMLVDALKFRPYIVWGRFYCCWLLHSVKQIHFVRGVFAGCLPRNVFFHAWFFGLRMSHILLVHWAIAHSLFLSHLTEDIIIIFDNIRIRCEILWSSGHYNALATVCIYAYLTKFLSSRLFIDTE